MGGGSNAKRIFLSFEVKNRHSHHTCYISQERFWDSQETFSIWQGNLNIRRTLMILQERFWTSQGYKPLLLGNILKM